MAAYTFIVNPVAGSGHTLEVEPILKARAEKDGLDAVFVRSERQGHTTELAREAAAAGGTVVAVGGDGTNYDVAAGLLGSGAALGIIPAGTGNDLIKTLGIPKDPEAAYEYMLSHDPRPMDIGTVNGRPFLNVFGTGFDVSVLDHTEKFKKRFRGLLPYLLGLIGAIFGNKPVRVAIGKEGSAPEEREILICSVANGRFIGGGIPICPVADPGDGKLDLVTVQYVPRWRIPFYLPGLMGSKILGFKITRHELVSSVTLRSEGMRVQIDGEIQPMDEAVLEIKPGALMVRY